MCQVELWGEAGRVLAEFSRPLDVGEVRRQAVLAHVVAAHVELVADYGIEQRDRLEHQLDHLARTDGRE